MKAGLPPNYWSDTIRVEKYYVEVNKTMLATVALVGRPNVGKSTLFNRLTRTRDAIVSDTPGLTRDRQYGIANIDGRNVILIDTGGLNYAQTPLESLMEKQTRLAIEEAQLVLFIVDAKSGLTTNDEILTNQLRKINKQLLLITNKIDGQNTAIVTADFHTLGFDRILAISAEHNIGISELKKVIIIKLPASKQEILKQNNGTIKITVVGRPNVGKSTLVNRILGEERVIAHNMPGTTRDSIFIDFTRHDKNYTLIDTAGVRRRSKIQEKIEKFSIIKTLQAISETNVTIFLVDATENITDQDLKLLSFVLEGGKALVIAVNKWDNLALIQRKKIKSELERRLNFVDFVNIHFISALHGTGVGNLFKSINNAYASANKELNTSELNKILEMAIKNYQPPMANGREIKLKFAHIGHYAPPTIIIHGVRLESLPENYRRYLEKFFRKSLKLSGTPIRIIFKDSKKS